MCLAEQDLIVDTLAVARYLLEDDEWRPSTPSAAAATHHIKAELIRRDGIEVAWFPRLDHAQVFDWPAPSQQICRLVQRYCSVGVE